MLSKARCLVRIRESFYRPPLTGAPISVADLHWVGLLGCGLSGQPTVATMQWQSKRGPYATDHKTVMGQLLAQARQQWGRQVHRVWDCCFAGTPWLFQALETNLHLCCAGPSATSRLTPSAEPRKA